MKKKKKTKTKNIMATTLPIQPQAQTTPLTGANRQTHLHRRNISNIFTFNFDFI